jgi:hypothetical protein
MERNVRQNYPLKYLDDLSVEERAIARVGLLQEANAGKRMQFEKTSHTLRISC